MRYIIIMVLVFLSGCNTLPKINNKKINYQKLYGQYEWEPLRGHVFHAINIQEDYKCKYSHEALAVGDLYGSNYFEGKWKIINNSILQLINTDPDNPRTIEYQILKYKNNYIFCDIDDYEENRNIEPSNTYYFIRSNEDLFNNEEEE